MSTILSPRLKAQAFTDTWQVEIVDLTGIYVRNAGMKSAAILDGAELCRVEEFAARHFRRSGFEATFLESEPFRVLFGVYLWSVIQDRGDRQVRTVGIMAHPGYGHGESSEVRWIPLPSDFGTADYSRRRAKALTKHLSAIAETRAELLRLFDSWLAPSAGLREYLGAHRRESVETARKLIELIAPAVLKTVLGYLILHYWGHRSGWPDLARAPGCSNAEAPTSHFILRHLDELERQMKIPVIILNPAFLVFVQFVTPRFDFSQKPLIWPVDQQVGPSGAVPPIMQDQVAKQGFENSWCH